MDERLSRGLQLDWWKLCFVLWVFSMIVTPLFPDHFLPLSYLSTLLLSLGIFGYALETYGAKTYVMFAVCFSFGVVVEYFGELTSFPFGRYVYTASGPHLFGVPLIVPLGWWAFSMIAISVPRKQKLFLAPLALVAWDLGLDPLMVKQAFWIFSPPGFYFAIPLSNFLGWYGAGLLLIYILLRLEPGLKQHSPTILRRVFAVQAFLMGVGLSVFYQMPLAGLVAASAMGLCLFISAYAKDR
jgi:lycopene beta-cyclase